MVGKHLFARWGGLLHVVISYSISPAGAGSYNAIFALFAAE